MHHTYQNHAHVDARELTITWARYQTIWKNLQNSRHQEIEKSTRNI